MHVLGEVKAAVEQVSVDPQAAASLNKLNQTLRRRADLWPPPYRCGLHLTSVAGALPEGGKFKSRDQGLSRFLQCKYFDPSSLAECRLGLMLGRQPPPGAIRLVDPTSIAGVEVVNAAIPLEGRAVPVAWIDFEYPWKTLTPASQNTLERYRLTWLTVAAPERVRPILIFDRGYAPGALIQDLHRGRHAFLIRGRSKVVVQAWVRGPA